jgi:hypothetical protein
MHLTLLYPLLVAVCIMMYGTAAANEDPDAWLQRDADDSTAQVNEGDLVFQPGTRGHRVLQTRNWLTITAESLQHGWVDLQQCQGNLDPVAAVEVVYRYHRLRNLRVISSRGIEHTRVEQNSVQMRQVQEGAEVCIEAEVQVLRPDGEGAYQLQSGPFHRRFLDGYYPVHLAYHLRWPADRLQLESVRPLTQQGFSPSKQPGELDIDTLFEGRLTIEVRFIEP